MQMTSYLTQYDRVERYAIIIAVLSACLMMVLLFFASSYIKFGKAYSTLPIKHSAQELTFEMVILPDQQERLPYVLVNADEEDVSHLDVFDAEGSVSQNTRQEQLMPHLTSGLAYSESDVEDVLIEQHSSQQFNADQTFEEIALQMMQMIQELPETTEMVESSVSREHIEDLSIDISSSDVLKLPDIELTELLPERIMTDIDKPEIQEVIVVPQNRPVVPTMRIGNDSNSSGAPLRNTQSSASEVGIHSLRILQSRYDDYFDELVKRLQSTFNEVMFANTSEVIRCKITMSFTIDANGNIVNLKFESADTDRTTERVLIRRSLESARDRGPITPPSKVMLSDPDFQKMRVTYIIR